MPTLTHGYNEQNHLETLTEDGETTTYIYDAVGNLKETQFPNGVVERQTYDELNRLQVLETVKVDAGVETLLTKFEYDLDDVGHRLEVKETLRQPDDSLLERTVKYEYDDLYRLTSEEVVGGDKVTFTYDDVGNRASQIVNGVTTTYEYDDNDRLLEELVDGVVIVSYTYDDNGNTKSRTKDGVTTNYVWDDRNRLIEVQTDGGTVAYEYDENNIRVSSTVDGVTTNYVLDSNRPYAQVLAEYTDGVLGTDYVYGWDLLSQERDGDESFYLVDGLSSTRVLTDENGVVSDSYTYDAYGNLINSTGGTENDYLFAGEQFDEDLGQYYLRQRYYDAVTGRFSRRDTYEGRLDEQITLHKYVYGNSNPANYIDPSGLFGLAEFSAAESIRNTLASIQASSYSYLVNATFAGGDYGLKDFLVDLAWNAGFAIVPFAVTSVTSRLLGNRLNRISPSGAKGPISGRPFDPNSAGGPIRKLTMSKVKINQRGIKRVEKHISRFEYDPANNYMINRLKAIADGKMQATQVDYNYYTHELREGIRYKKLGYPNGQPSGNDAAHELWNNAHTATLEEFGVRDSDLLHPGAIKASEEYWTKKYGF